MKDFSSDAEWNLCDPQEIRTITSVLFHKPGVITGTIKFCNLSPYLLVPTSASASILDSLPECCVK
jgi:hypothetical protein